MTSAKEISDKRKSRGLIKKVEHFGDVFADYPLPFANGVIGIILVMCLVYIGNIKKLHIVKNRKFNTVLNAIVNFILGWLLIPLRILGGNIKVKITIT